jgi:hypothetical protein
MTVRVVKEEPFDEERERVLRPPFRFEPPTEPERSLQEPVHPQAVAVQAVAVLTALAAIITPKLVLMLAVISAAGLTAYAISEHNVLADTASGLFDGLTLVLAFAKGEWRR